MPPIIAATALGTVIFSTPSLKLGFQYYALFCLVDIDGRIPMAALRGPVFKERLVEDAAHPLLEEQEVFERVPFFQGQGELSSLRPGTGRLKPSLTINPIYFIIRRLSRVAGLLTQKKSCLPAAGPPLLQRRRLGPAVLLKDQFPVPQIYPYAVSLPELPFEELQCQLVLNLLLDKPL